MQEKLEKTDPWIIFMIGNSFQNYVCNQSHHKLGTVEAWHAGHLAVPDDINQSTGL